MLSMIIFKISRVAIELNFLILKELLQIWKMFETKSCRKE